MSTRHVVLALALGFVVVGCEGASDVAPTAEEKAEMDAKMKAEMEAMQKMVPKKLGTAPPQTPPASGTN